MANLTFADSHNMVAYLEKSAVNADFAEIVDFLSANPIRKTKIKVIEMSHSSGPSTLVVDETVYEERGDRVERAATTAASLDAEQDSGTITRTQSTTIPNKPVPQGTGLGGSPRRQDTILGDRSSQTRFERLSKQSHEPSLSRVNTFGSGKDSMQLMELIELCTKMFDRVLVLENNKTAQDLEITHLKKRVKRLEKKRKSRTSQLKRSTPITTAGVSVITAKPSTPPTTTTTIIEDEDLTITQTLMKMRSEKSKEKAKEKGSKEKSSKTATRPTRGVIMREASETTTRPTVPPQQKLDPKDKCKGKMVEPEIPLKKKDQIMIDEEVVKNLEAQLQAKLEEEERLEKGSETRAEGSSKRVGEEVESDKSKKQKAKDTAFWFLRFVSCDLVVRFGPAFCFKTCCALPKDKLHFVSKQVAFCFKARCVLLQSSLRFASKLVTFCFKTLTFCLKILAICLVVALRFVYF
uniref:Uncharacterized protein n=1 Tax=Tanacetum cinerariifolium TaxID=118510 RepID=A0A699HVS5_TANCI|nr:hypothetical protein [Tanacetum cinerariifolium]